MPAGQRFSSVSSAIISLACDFRCTCRVCCVKCLCQFRLPLVSRQEELDGWHMWHELWRGEGRGGELYIGCWWGNVRERRNRFKWEDVIKNGSVRNWFVESGLDLRDSG